MIAITDVAHRVLAAVQAAAPAPRDGVPVPVATAPPGADKIDKVLGWGLWVAIAVAVGGVLVVAGKMAISHRRGEGGEHASGLGWVLVACILMGSASGIVKAFV